MKLFEFEKYFPNEEACKDKFRVMREQQGVICPKCGCKHHYWITSKQMFQCAKCRYRQSLKANTILHGSKLPFRYWFISMHLLTATKHTFSAAELQRQLGHNRYQPIWELCHKLRDVMGQRDAEYQLKGSIELDEGFFTVERPESEKNVPLKRGRGSQAKSKVLVMAESKSTESKKHTIKKKVGFIKMVVIPDLTSDTITVEVINNINSDAELVTDDSTSYTKLNKHVKSHKSQVIPKKEVGKVLPWVHLAITNAKSLLTDTYHGIKREYLQSYLNEFCYKFNRRYYGEDVFYRLLSICTCNQSDFEHRIYNKNAA
jgi:transposase-like protein/predicted nucleic-acid-binding Zn-ribbon protein